MHHHHDDYIYIYYIFIVRNMPIYEHTLYIEDIRMFMTINIVYISFVYM